MASARGVLMRWIVGALVVCGFATGAFSVARADPAPASKSDVLFARIDRLLRARTLEANVTLTPSQRSQLQALAARFAGAPSASRVTDLRKFLTGFAGPQKTDQLNALVGYVIRAALLPRSKGLDGFLDALNVKLAESRKLRTELKCAENAAVPVGSWLRLSMTACTPTVKSSGFAQFDAKLAAVQGMAAKLQAVEDAAAGPTAQLQSALVDAAALSSSAEYMLALSMKLQTDANDEQMDEREELERELALQQARYEAYSAACAQGAAAACAKLPEIAALIADLEAQIAAL